MIHKHLISILISLVIISSFFLIYQTEAAEQLPAPAHGFTLELVPPTGWETWRPLHNTVLTFSANIRGDSTQITSTTKYVFTLRDVSDWTLTGSTNTTYIVTGLTSGTQHLFQVRAVNNNNLKSLVSNNAFSTPQ